MLCDAGYLIFADYNHGKKKQEKSQHLCTCQKGKREAAALMKPMNETMGKARKELADVFAELERMRKDERN